MPNPKLLLLLYSFRHEFKLLLSAFLIVLSVPIIAVVVLTHTGLEIVSDALVQINPLTKAIQLYYPNGQLFKEINLQVNWPVKGVVTLEFGEVDLPYQPLHSGIDIAGKTGDPVTPFLKGKVIYVDEISWGYGKHIIIDHGNNLTSLYGHLSKINVKKDDEVKPGD